MKKGQDVKKSAEQGREPEKEVARKPMTDSDLVQQRYQKLEELKRSGTFCQVFDATVAGNVQKALSGEVVGTIVLCG